jgi:hypothetical protein
MTIPLFVLKIGLFGVLAVDPARTQSGVQLRWSADNPYTDATYLPLVLRPENRSPGITSDLVRAAVLDAAMSWQAATANGFDFDLWVGSGGEDYPAALAFDGISSFFFASQNPGFFASSNPDNPLNPATAAYTQLWIDSSTQEIVQADMVLNDLDFRFVSRTMPRETWPDFLVNDERVALLEDTIMHEFGHVLGLDHSTSYESTMYTFGWFDEVDLSCDDVAGIRQIYGPVDHFVGGLASTLVDANGFPLLGASVTAISLADPQRRYSTLTDALGQAYLSGLEPGDYLVLSEPVRVDAASFSPYYAEMSHRICPDANGALTMPFARSFFGGDVLPQIVSVSANSVRELGPWPMKCSATAGLDALPFSGTSRENAPELWPVESSLPDATKRRVSFLDRFDVSGAQEVRYVNLGGFEGELRVTALTYSLFSGVSVRARLLDASGNEVSVESEGPVSAASPGRNFVNYDNLMIARSLPWGSYMLELRATDVAASTMSQGALMRDATFFALVDVVLGTRIGLDDVRLPCTPDRSLFAPYVQLAGRPRRLMDEPKVRERGCSMVSSGRGESSWYFFAALPLLRRRARRADLSLIQREKRANLR